MLQSITLFFKYIDNELPDIEKWKFTDLLQYIDLCDSLLGLFKPSTNDFVYQFWQTLQVWDKYDTYISLEEKSFSVGQHLTRAVVVDYRVIFVRTKLTPPPIPKSILISLDEEEIVALSGGTYHQQLLGSYARRYLSTRRNVIHSLFEKRLQDLYARCCPDTQKVLRIVMFHV